MVKLHERFPHVLVIEGSRMYCKYCKRTAHWLQHDAVCESAPGYNEAVRQFVYVDYPYLSEMEVI